MKSNDMFNSNTLIPEDYQKSNNNKMSQSNRTNINNGKNDFIEEELY